ncbi:MAG TPA: S8 family serine peptidase, partial [Candidatus Thermoplasmatota archaeon]|nr:S8 family serine peptidase [Candidatus Thermoplasmatota archaeon]
MLALVLLAPTAAALTLVGGEETLLVGHERGAKATVVPALAALGVRVDLSLDALDVLRVAAPSVLGTERILAVPGVAFVERDLPTRIAGAQWNGAQWDGAQWDGAQWNGAQWNGALGPDGTQWGHAAIRAPEAWAIEPGRRAVTVCVVDSGVDASHPDLAANAAGAPGYNALSAGASAEDDAGHGTHVAGIVAAVRGNGVGVAGVTESRVISAKVLDASGTGRVTNLALGMVWCANEGAGVALLALSVDGQSRT